MQLIYGGKARQKFPIFIFPKLFSLSANSKDFSNTEESLRWLEEIMIPYVNSERSKLGVREEP